MTASSTTGHGETPVGEEHTLPVPARSSWATLGKLLASLVALSTVALLAGFGLPTRHVATNSIASKSGLQNGEPPALADGAGVMTAYLPGLGALRMGRRGALRTVEDGSEKAAPAVLDGLRASAARAGLREVPGLREKALRLLSARSGKSPSTVSPWTAAEAGSYCTGTAFNHTLFLAWVPATEALFSLSPADGRRETALFELPGIVEVRPRGAGSLVVRHLWDDGEIHSARASDVWLPSAFRHPGGEILVTYEVPGTLFCIARNPGSPVENCLFYEARMAAAGWTRTDRLRAPQAGGTATLSFERGARRYVVHLTRADPPLHGTAVTVMQGDR